MNNSDKNNKMETLQKQFNKAISSFIVESEQTILTFGYWKNNFELYQLGETTGLDESSLTVFAALLLSSEVECRTVDEETFQIMASDRILKSLAREEIKRRL